MGLVRPAEAAPPKESEEVMHEFDGSIRNFCEITRMLYPNCRICYGDDDQIVIYTGAMLEMGGEVCQWEPEDEDQYQSWCDRHPEVG